MRWRSEGAGDFEVETITRPQRGTERHAAPARRRGGVPVGLEAEVDRLEVLRPHLAADPDAEGGVGREAKKQVTKDEWATVNKAAALWTRSKSEITPEQYEEFYKQISYDTEAPLAYTHNRVEGRSEYTQLLYIPAQGAVRPLEPRQARRRQAVRQARLHHGRRRGADAGLPALRQGRDRLRRPAAQRRRASCCRRAATSRRSAKARPSACCRCSKALADSEDAAEKDEVRRVLEGLRRRC